MLDIINSIQSQNFNRTIELLVKQIELLLTRYPYQEVKYDEEQYKKDRKTILDLTVNFNHNFIPPLSVPNHNPALEVQWNTALVNNLPDGRILFEILDSLMSFIITYEEGKDRWSISEEEYLKTKELLIEYKLSHLRPSTLH